MKKYIPSNLEKIDYNQKPSLVIRDIMIATVADTYLIDLSLPDAKGKVMAGINNGDYGGASIMLAKATMVYLDLLHDEGILCEKQ